MKSINHPNIVKLIDNFYEEVDKVDFSFKKEHLSQPNYGVCALHTLLYHQR